MSFKSRSQWLRGLRHDQSWVMGSNPTRDRMTVCVYSVFVLFCVQVAVLRRADPPFKEPYRLFIGLRKCKAAKAQQRAVEP
jgi:hypothetical protein